MHPHSPAIATTSGILLNSTRYIFVKSVVTGDSSSEGDPRLQWTALVALSSALRYNLNMSHALITIAKCVLVVAFLGGFIACERANTRMLKRARDSGYRYWLIIPMASFAGLRGIEPLIFAIGLATMVLSIIALKALSD